MRSEAMTRDFNLPLNGLRGFAAFAVVIFHLVTGALDGKFLPTSSQWVIFPSLTLQFGVELFFMISGYLITLSVVRHADTIAFLRDRAHRVYPAFLPILLLLFLAGPLIGYDHFRGVSAPEWLGLFFANLFFLPGLAPMPAALLVAWTLSYEAAFYLFASGTFALSRVTPRKVTIVLATLAAAPLIIAYPRAAFFAVGVGVFFAQRHLGRFAPMLGALALPALVGFFVSCLFYLGHPFTPVGAAFEGGLVWHVLALIAGAIVFAAVVVKAGPFARFLETRPMQWLGAISYSLYLWHTMVMFGTKRVAAKVFDGDLMTFAAFAASTLLITLPLSWASYELFERGVPKLLKRRSAAAPMPA